MSNRQIVFSEPGSSRTGPLGWNEPNVHWYTEITTPEARRSREVINRWFAASSVKEDANFINRLCSENNNEHGAALDELYTDHLLQSTGEIRYEEEPYSPDFRIYRGGECYAAVEVASLFRASEHEQEWKTFGTLADQINERFKCGTHAISFEIVKLTRTPPVHQLVRFLHEQLNKLDATLHEEYPTTAVYKDPGVQIEITFYRYSEPPTASNYDDRTVLVGPAIGGVVTTGARLLKTLSKKLPSRYDVRDVPYAVISFLHDEFSSLHQLEQAILGRGRINIDDGAWSRSNDGFFGRRDRTQFKNKRVGAVFAVPPWRSWIPEESRILRLDNPEPALEFPEDIITVHYRLARSDDPNGNISMVWTPEIPTGIPAFGQ